MTTAHSEAMTPHYAFDVLPAAGAFDSSGSFTPIYTGNAAASLGGRIDLSSGGRLAVTVEYTADAGATNGYPGFYVAWQKRLDDSTTATSYDQTPLGTVTPDANDAPILCYRTRIECNGLTDASAGYADFVFSVPPGAIGVRIEPAEIGDTANPGTFGAWLGRAP